MEEFKTETIEAAIRSQGSGLLDHQRDDAATEGIQYPEDRDVEQRDVDGELGPLSEAVKWVQERDQSGLPLTGQSAAGQLDMLRAWAEEHKEIRIPHPKATLILHLLRSRHD